MINVNAKVTTNRSNLKKTAQGTSKNTRFTSKNDKRNKKTYRGQGK